MDASVPDLAARKSVSKWRLELFYSKWGESQTNIRRAVLDWYGVPANGLYGRPLRMHIKRRWLILKTLALVESDRLLMPDGPGALNRSHLKGTLDGL